MVYFIRMGTLFIVSTPIGNLEDISLRALGILFSSEIIASEDTRRTWTLLSELRKRFPLLTTSQHEPKLIRYDDRTERTTTPELIELLTQGTSMALVTDAGTPLISDPGFVLVREARKRSIPVTSVPGPSSPIAALSVSGLPADKFLFLGYYPEKQSHRKRLLESLTSFAFPVTVIFFAAPHKLIEDLEDMLAVFGDCQITITRELTKMHEEVWKGTISESISHFSDPKGEFVLLFDTRDII